MFRIVTAHPWLFAAAFSTVLVFSSVCPAEESSVQRAMPFQAITDTTNATCLTCHGNPELTAVSGRGQTLNLLVDARLYERSVHATQNCVSCHAGSVETFSSLPHTFDVAQQPGCVNCHEKALAEPVADLMRSEHYKKLGTKLSCPDCHNAHTQRPREWEDRYENFVASSNQICLDCHTSKQRFQALSNREIYTQNLGHDFLPAAEKHLAAVRCVECHSPTERFQPHIILPKDQSVRDCAQCHDREQSLIVTRMATFTDIPRGPGAFLGKGFFDETALLESQRAAQVNLNSNSVFVQQRVPVAELQENLQKKATPGFKGNLVQDKGIVLLLLVLGMIAVHAGVRYASKRALGQKTEPQESARRKSYIYTLPTRLLHWLNALAFVLLIITGACIRMGGGFIGLEGAVCVHNWTGVFLAAHFTAFVVVSVISGDIRQYLPHFSGLGTRLWRQGRYYLYGMFRGEEKPFPISREQRFNPLQQVTYLVVYCMGLPVLLLSGLLLLMPGLAMEKEWLLSFHYVLAWAYALFLAGHIYLTTLGGQPLDSIKAMLTGNHIE